MTLQAYVENFQRRVMQDALAQATAAYWDRRAAEFRAVGTPTADATALTCEHHAQFVRDNGIDEEMRTLVRTAVATGTL